MIAEESLMLLLEDDVLEELVCVAKHSDDAGVNKVQSVVYIPCDEDMDSDDVEGECFLFS